MVKVKVTYNGCGGKSVCFVHRNESDAKDQAKRLRELNRSVGMSMVVKIVK